MRLINIHLEFEIDNVGNSEFVEIPINNQNTNKLIENIMMRENEICNS